MQGYGPDMPWKQVMRGAGLVGSGLPWVASNTDMTIPTATGSGPGNGALVKLVAEFAGREPEVAGKPQPPLFRETLTRVGGEHPLVVGDRLDTDIEGAVTMGWDSLLVLTGVTGLEELVAAGPDVRPTYVAPDLAALAQPQPAPEETDDRGPPRWMDRGRRRRDAARRGTRATWPTGGASSRSPRGGTWTTRGSLSSPTGSPRPGSVSVMSESEQEQPPSPGRAADRGLPDPADPPPARRTGDGHAGVDAVVASLDGLDDAPVGDHVAVFEQAHESLRRALSDAGDGAPTRNQGPATVPPRRLRLDAELVRRGLARSREHASELIARGPGQRQQGGRQQARDRCHHRRRPGRARGPRQPRTTRAGVGTSSPAPSRPSPTRA